ncbi:MAG TPA: hypothetical protein ENJ19_00690 [Gammaproteobacteria bacterium]|nr:hypothetical protein [Gammaproteobacteria bacterium]
MGIFQRNLIPARCIRRFALAAAIAGLVACAPKPAVVVDQLPTPRDEARSAYLQGDYERVLRIVGPMAESGKAWAQYTLGYMQFYGEGVAQNKAAGRQWIERAAAQAHPPAQAALAEIRQAERAAAAARKEADMAAAEARAAPPPPKNEPALVQVDESAATPVAPVGAPKGPEWVATEDPNRYTIQLISSRREHAIRRYVLKEKLGSRAGYFPYRLEGEAWYAVVYGSYASAEEAQAAIATLPPHLRESSPWVRNFGSIQALMRESGFLITP